MDHTHEALTVIRQMIEWLALGVELLAVAVIVSGVLLVIVRYKVLRYFFHPAGDPPASIAYQDFKRKLGGALLLGLEFMVAADLIRTVALEPTFANVGVLGLLVLIRTFLSWTLTVESEGRWPWQQAQAEQSDASR